MPDSLQEILQKKGPFAVLKRYGLDQMLTDQDDPALWAAALAHHWPAPWTLEMQPVTLRFGVGRVPAEGEEGIQIARSGMQQLEVWCFERGNAETLRIVPCPEPPRLSFMGVIASGDLSAMSDPKLSFIRDYLDVSRPSHGEARALVHKGMSVPPKAGSGETRYWVKSENATWVETEEVFSRWLA